MGGLLPGHCCYCDIGKAASHLLLLITLFTADDDLAGGPPVLMDSEEEQAQQFDSLFQRWEGETLNGEAEVRSSTVLWVPSLLFAKAKAKRGNADNAVVFQKAEDLN